MLVGVVVVVVCPVRVRGFHCLYGIEGGIWREGKGREWGDGG